MTHLWVAIAVAYACGVVVGVMAGSNLTRAKCLQEEIQRRLDRLKRFGGLQP
jgi:uncharacterized membrane-anchored protein YhcB (DUF1043 family)